MDGSWVLRFYPRDGSEPYGTIRLAQDGTVHTHLDVDGLRANDLETGAHKNHGPAFEREFTFAPYTPATIAEAVGMAVGAASVCFDTGKVPGGAFDTKFASSIVDALVKEFEKFAQERVEADRRTRSPFAGLLLKNFGAPANAIFPGVEAPSEPRFTTELVPTRYEAYVNGVDMGSVVRYKTGEHLWYMASSGSHTRKGLRDVLARRINTLSTPDSDEITESSGDLHVKLVDPEFFKPTQDDEDDAYEEA